MSEDLERFAAHCGFDKGFLSENLWAYLKAQEKPIWLYGMGNGAEKILRALAINGLFAEGVFASDDYAKDKLFCGYRIKRFSAVKEQYEKDGFIILLCFAAFRDDLYPEIMRIASEYELYAPDVPVVFEQDGLFTPDYCAAHAEELTEVYDMLSDEQSRKVFRDVIAFKCSGKPHYLDRCYTGMDEVYEKLICPQQSDVYVDLGAYNGDTVTDFLSNTGGMCRRVVALEPDAKNYKKLLGQIERLKNAAGNTIFEPVQAGAHSASGTLRFSGTTGRSGMLTRTGDVLVPVCAVDELLRGERADVIKLDVEGAEREALFGCEQTIRRYHPRLMVSAYHRNEDLFALPLQIMQMYPHYRLYLRHHRYIPAWETCYYFVPINRDENGTKEPNHPRPEE